MLLAAPEIGGGIVRRGGLSFGERQLMAGERLTGDEIRSMPRANQVAWMDSRAIEVWPVADPSEPLERFMVHVGQGKFFVVEGRKLTDDPMSKAEAEALAKVSYNKL